jgi:glucose-6-phosphate isomerase
VNEGAEKFLIPFDKLIGGLAARRREVLAHRLASVEWIGDAGPAAVPGALVAATAQQRLGVRLAAHDPSIWSDDPETMDRIRNRLGWLDAPGRAADEVYEATRFASELRDEGVEQVVLLGMGGSSLCPLVAATTFGPIEGYPELIVLDNVDPDAIREVMERIDPLRTLFLVASKSGSTIETMSLYRIFYEFVREAGETKPGSRFVALTDPGSELVREAQNRGFRRTFLTPTDVGGRFSALTSFGLLPMALAGIDVQAIVASADDMAAECSPDIPDPDNPALMLGVVLASLRDSGRDKLTLIASPGLSAFPLWIEQLVAESTGKNGTGIIPITHEPVVGIDGYGPDRVFVYMSLEGERDSVLDGVLEALAQDEHPVLRIALPRPEAIGGEFLRWEIATSIAGALLGVNPFDEPDVTASKLITREILDRSPDGEMPDSGEPAAASDYLEVHVDDGQEWAAGLGRDTAGQLIRDFVNLAGPADYMGVLAFLAGSPERDALLGVLRERLQARTGVATTSGYGPRYLHSSGQLYKGGPNTGVYLLLTSDASVDIPIPDSQDGFAVLQRAQALGDERAMLERGRRVLRVNLGWYVDDGLEALVEALD